MKTLVNSSSARLRVSLSDGSVIEIAPFGIAHVAPGVTVAQTVHATPTTTETRSHA